MMWKKPLVVTLLTVALAAVSGCATRAEANEVLGVEKAPEGYVKANVQDLAEGDKWKDQKVLFEGTIAKLGCAGCGGVIIADKTWRISAEPEDPSKFRIPVRTGARLRIWGVLSVSSDGFREVKAQRVEFLDAQKDKPT